MSTIRKFIDIGANLTDLMYAGIYNENKKHENDLDSVLKRAWDGGLEKIIITGTSLVTSQRALELAKFDDRLYTTVGCHPTNCLQFEENPDNYLENLGKLIENNKDGKIVAFGECGLDYDRLQFCSKYIQQKYFKQQLNLNKKYKLPLFLHCRNSALDLYEILKDYPEFKGVIHSFDGTIDEANKFISLGYYIGLNGCSLKTDENLKVITELPSKRILLETDCPWCEIRPSHAGYNLIQDINKKIPTVKKEKWKINSMVKGRNEPINIRQVFDIVAGIRNEEPNQFVEVIWKNTNDLFW